MPARERLWIGLASLPWVLSVACIKITTTVVNIGQKSSLEKQLMGEMEPLTEEEMLAASVRTAGENFSGSEGDPLAHAVAARQRQLFNRDDVDELKSLGCLGEALRGRLVARNCEREGEAQMAKLRERVIEEENTDRGKIIDWAIRADPMLTRTDRPQVEALYHHLVSARARPGDWVQNEDGSWSKR